ncbi:asialoglycoprotein receptor 1-like [Elgaria multicarinata webbii]|uniref:asialoglycoprotein receptor 1-like n=1 Tax=Elgaria multicarinata webbii TaxID=159646 RepID=UPI002FCCBDFE
MIKDYQDVKSLDTEDEGDIYLRRGPVLAAPAQSWGRRVCSGRRLILILLGFICIFVISTVAFGFTGRKFDSGLSGMQEDFKSVNHTLFVELAALKRKETEDLQKLTKIDRLVKNLTEQVTKAKTEFRDQIFKFRKSIRTLNCELEDIKRNRTGSKSNCCPKGWDLFAKNCYWVSNMEKTWEEAKVDCEDKDSHLVTITSYLEQQFVAQRTKTHNTWIGLTYENNVWKWVDGTTYTVRRIDWRPGEPNLFSFSDFGDAAHCAFLYRDGLWSDERCAHQYTWMCEMEFRA